MSMHFDNVYCNDVWAYGLGNQINKYILIHAYEIQYANLVLLDLEEEDASARTLLSIHH